MNQHHAAEPLRFEEHGCPGTFGARARLCLYPSPQYKWLVVNLHGSFGNMSGAAEKYLRFAEALQSDGRQACALFETSRLELGDSGPTDPWLRKLASFEGKTFEQELGDCRRLLRLLLDQEKARGRLSTRLCLNGNSIGGLLALFLARDFPEVHAISTVGTGLRLSAEGVEYNRLAMTMPPPEEVARCAAEFRGLVLNAWGSRDEIFSRADLERLCRAFSGSAKQALHIHEAVDHPFNQLDGKASPAPYAAHTRHLLELLQSQSGG